MLELVEHSFVRRREQGPDGYRFSMLEVVREFGAGQLEAAGELTAAREAHAAWVLELARKAEPRMAGPEQVEWLDRLAQEHDNIRRVVGWLTERERIEEALDLTGSLWFFRWIRGFYDEARRQFDILLALPAGGDRTVARAKALIGLGIVASHQGDVPHALEAFEEAIAILQVLDEQWHLSLALACYGTAYHMIGRIDECERHLSESQATADRLGDAWLWQGSICNFGVIALSRGQWDRGRQFMEESVRASRSIGDRWGLSIGELNLGYIDMHEGNLDSAESHIQTSVRLIEELNDKRDLPGAYCSMAEILRQRGQLAEAKAMLDSALMVARDIGDRTQIANALTGLAHIVHLQGEHRAAVDLMGDAMRSFERGGHLAAALMRLDDIADMALALGDGRHAAWC
ncbi:MAG TPA: tetratricopeptide repeat protein, partial [Thermomicrobiales bacterium]|nr:tetratricopeptide repeat protein [Thermomicrobiales bacterium]